MLVYFEPAGLCHLQGTDIIMAPLPSKKQLWEAQDEATWLAQSVETQSSRTTFALAGNGELVKLDLDQLCGNGLGPTQHFLKEAPPTTTTENWDEWCSGMDNLGGLVMLAASLTSCTS